MRANEILAPDDKPDIDLHHLLCKIVINDDYLFGIFNCLSCINEWGEPILPEYDTTLWRDTIEPHTDCISLEMFSLMLDSIFDRSVEGDPATYLETAINLLNSFGPVE